MYTYFACDSGLELVLPSQLVQEVTPASWRCRTHPEGHLVWIAASTLSSRIWVAVSPVCRQALCSGLSVIPIVIVEIAVTSGYAYYFLNHSSRSSGIYSLATRYTFYGERTASFCDFSRICYVPFPWHPYSSISLSPLPTLTSAIWRRVAWFLMQL